MSTSMAEIVKKLNSNFSSLFINSLINIYQARFKRTRLLTMYGIPKNVCWLIEGKFSLAGEIFDVSFLCPMPSLGKSTYTKKHKVKMLGVIHVHARLTTQIVISWGMYLIIMWIRFNSLCMGWVRSFSMTTSYQLLRRIIVVMCNAWSKD